MRLAAIIFVMLMSLAFAEEEKNKSTTVLMLGDSLTEGHGLSKEEAYPSLVEKLAKDAGYKNIKVINGGVSGSTTASGLSRLNWFFKAKPDIIVIALGANDGLRGVKLEKSKENLENIILKCKDKGMTIVLAAVKLPLNYGKEYRAQFEKMFVTLKDKHKIHFIPFLLEGVAGKSELNLADGIHPNEAGQKIVAKIVYKHLEPLL